MALLFVRSAHADVQPIIQFKQAHNQSKCSLHAIDEYPGWFTDKLPRYDFVLLNSLIALYLFLGIAIVCDEYCVPAVERICYTFHLSYDVAGATLMAVASSSPEFFINFYATFLTEGDMGLGTIVGSSVFNALAIPALCCLFTSVHFSIDWWPITRDLLWYSLCIVLLTFCLWDSYIFWWEALIFVILYFLNVANLLLDQRLQAVVRDKERPCKLICFIPLGEVKDFVEMVDPFSDEPPFDFWHWPENTLWDKFIWLLSYPLQFLFLLTIPNIRRNFLPDWNSGCLVMSIVWISLLTYLCSWSITVVGYYLSIPESVMGLVVLAFGTSIPEAVSSVIVTRKGYGSMAICNAVGSNTVDILVCLGLPWLVKALWFPASPERNAVFIISDGLAYSSVCLLISALLLYISFMATRFQMERCFGILCLIMYVTFVLLAVLFEMFIFEKSLPHCPI